MRHSTRRGSTTPLRSASPRCEHELRGTIARRTAATVDPERIVVTTGSSGGFILAFLSMFEARRPRRCHRSGLSAVPAYPDRARLRAGADRNHRSDAPRAVGRGAAGRAPQEAVAGRAGREPGQSDRHHDDARSADRADRGGGRRRHSLHLRRNLSRAGLCVSGRDRRLAVRRRAGDQLVLEILLHDRLAGRLGRGTGGAGAADRTAAAEFVDLGADAVADRG